MLLTHNPLDKANNYNLPNLEGNSIKHPKVELTI